MNNIKSKNNKAMLIVVLFAIVIAAVAFGLARSEKAFAYGSSGSTPNDFPYEVQYTQVLYNSDGQPSFVLANLLPTGYAIFNSQTDELLELSLAGSSPFDRIISGVLVYGGPGAYFVETADGLIKAEDAPKFQGVLPFADKTASLGQEAVFAGANYIDNWEYFYRHPWHTTNTSSNPDAPDIPNIGACGVVAAQMMLSYHNYYTDSRIIPAMHDGNDFLFHETVSGVRRPQKDDLSFHPQFQRARGIEPHGASGVGRCQRLGTTNAMFNNLLAFEPAGLQDMTAINRRIRDFLNAHYRDASGNSLSENVDRGVVTVGLYAAAREKAITEIDANRPVILGFEYAASGSYHIVVGYGRHTIDGTHGFIVNWGHTGGPSHVWANQGWFASALSMEVKNVTHNFVSTGEVFDENGRMAGNAAYTGAAYGGFECSTTGIRTIRPLFNTSSVSSGVSITGVNDTLTGSIKIPSTIKGQTVVAIGSSVFANKHQLTQITIPASVDYIGDQAFKGCVNLASVSFGSNSRLNAIGHSAFAGCNSLTGVTIPASVIFIRESAFKGCADLSRVTFEQGSKIRYVYGLEDYAFAYCPNLTRIDFNVAILGDFYSTSKVFYGAGRDSVGVSLNIGAEVTRIPEYLFSGADIASINFESPSKVTLIGSNALTGFTGNHLTIPQSVTSIGSNAFNSGTAVEWQGRYIFKGNTFIKYLGNDSSFTIPAMIAGVEITAVAAEAFAGNTSLRQCIIPASVAAIGEDAFANCTNLTIFADAVNKPAGWHDSFNPDNVPVVWDWSNMCYTLINNGTEYEVSKGSINSSIIYIPSHYNGKPVTSIGSSGFAQMANLTTVIFQENSNIKTVKAQAFHGCVNLSSIVLPDSITSIGSNLFSDCAALTVITIPQKVTRLGLNIFSADARVEWQGRYIFKGNTFIQYLGNDISFTVPAAIAGREITAVAANAFAGNTSMSECILPITVTDIGQDAFANCTNLTIFAEAVNKPAGWHDNFNPGNVTVIWNLPDAVLGLSYTLINNGTEYEVSKGSVNSPVVFIPSHYNGKPVTSISNFGFAFMTNLTTVIFQENSNIETVKAQAFHGCVNLSNIILPSSVFLIGEGAFIDCKSLTSIIIPNGLMIIQANVFLDCTGLKSVYIPSGVFEIGQHAFQGCISLLSVDIPETVLQIHNYAFLGCHSLASINFSANSWLRYIGAYAFLDCVNLITVSVPKGVTTIGQQAFHGCTRLTLIYIPASVVNIGWFAFVGSAPVIYTAHIAIPVGWDAAFNPSGGRVVWNYQSW